MKFALPFVCIALVVAYAAGVHYFYKDHFAADLGDRAKSLLSSTKGLEDVRVEFRAFDAFLSGNVPSSELRDRAAGLVASLPAARVVSNGIAYPGFDPGAAARAADAALAAVRPAAGPPRSPAPAEPPPPPRVPAHLEFNATGESIVFTGAVPDITVKSSLLRAIALSGRYLDVDSGDFAIDPALAPLDWSDELPGFIAFLLTRATMISLAINGVEVQVTAIALDSVSRDQILSRLNAIDFPGRHLRIDISQAPELRVEAQGFFFKADLSNGKLTMHGRLKDRAQTARFTEILDTDLPDLDVADELAVADALAVPEWSARLPNILSLICTRADGARISTNGRELRVIAEMKPSHAPEDLADVLSLMTGPAVTLEARLLPHEDELAPGRQAGAPATGRN